MVITYVPPSFDADFISDTTKNLTRLLVAEESDFKGTLVEKTVLK